MEETFNKQNVENLSQTCQRIVKLLAESPKGDYMMVQLLCLAENIKDFKDNPIVINSGV